MTYKLWDTCSGDLVGTLPTKEQALAIVRETVMRHGRAFAEWFLLGQEDKAGRSRLIAEGKVLVALALNEAGGEQARAG